MYEGTQASAHWPQGNVQNLVPKVPFGDTRESMQTRLEEMTPGFE